MSKVYGSTNHKLKKKKR